MFQFSQRFNQTLALLNQRQLNQGEQLLLAKALADTLPLAPADTENIALFTLTFRAYLTEVVYVLNNHTYLDEAACKALYKRVDEFSLWRMNIAHNPPSVLFSGEPDTVVDDLSCLLRYVDRSAMCAVSDMANRANASYAMFRELAQAVYNQMPARQG